MGGIGPMKNYQVLGEELLDINNLEDKEKKELDKVKEEIEKLKDNMYILFIFSFIAPIIYFIIIVNAFIPLNLQKLHNIFVLNNLEYEIDLLPN